MGKDIFWIGYRDFFAFDKNGNVEFVLELVVEVVNFTPGIVNYSVKFDVVLRLRCLDIQVGFGFDGVNPEGEGLIGYVVYDGVANLFADVFLFKDGVIHEAVEFDGL